MVGVPPVLGYELGMEEEGFVVVDVGANGEDRREGEQELLG